MSGPTRRTRAARGGRGRSLRTGVRLRADQRLPDGRRREAGLGRPGRAAEGRHLTVTSKEFTEQLILGAIMGIAFKAAGAEVLDRTGIQGSIGAREAVKNGDADGMYEYTGTAWITYLGHTKPIPDPQEQWQAVRDADREERHHLAAAVRRSTTPTRWP